MNYIIGIDGGGTKTNCAIADSSGNILFACTGSASNFLIEGAQKTSKVLFSLALQCMKKLNADSKEAKIIVIGAAGAGRKINAEVLQKNFISLSKSRGTKFKNVIVESDARIALEGAFGGKAGVILISGTGSIVLAKDSKENIYRAGGLGRIIGDEGSGYSIGKKGLQAFSKEIDGRGDPTLISKLIKDKFRISSTDELINKVYGSDFNPANAAPLVIAAAERGDRTALSILDSEADELVQHVYAISKKMKRNDFNISFTGGIIGNDNLFTSILKEKILKTFSLIKLTNPKCSPVEGAILIGKKIISEK